MTGIWNVHENGVGFTATRLSTTVPTGIVGAHVVVVAVIDPLAVVPVAGRTSPGAAEKSTTRLPAAVEVPTNVTVIVFAVTTAGLVGVIPAGAVTIGRESGLNVHPAGAVKTHVPATKSPAALLERVMLPSVVYAAVPVAALVARLTFVDGGTAVTAAKAD